MWHQITGKKVAQVLGQDARIGANYASAVLDSITAAKMMHDLGIKGRVLFKSVKGKQYIIFKGFAGKRSIFTGTRYLANNPKVIDMAIGKMGVNKSILEGARLTIFAVVPLNIVNYILSDNMTMSQLIGETATDLVKVGVASALAALLSSAVAATTTLAAGPLIVAIAVGIAVGLTLDALDKQFGVTDKLVKALDNAYDATMEGINKLDRTLRWQMLNGISPGRGIFY